MPFLAWLKKLTYREVPIRQSVILADNHEVFRAGLAGILAIEEGLRIVGQCDDAPCLLRAVQHFGEATVVFSSSLKINIIELGKALREAKSRSIVILDNGESVEGYLAWGTTGIVRRDISAEELLHCISQVNSGRIHVQQDKPQGTSKSQHAVVGERMHKKLTSKEVQIVRLIVKGYSNKDIAASLNNTEQVIKNYLSSIFDKTGVSNRHELALCAMHNLILAESFLEEATLIRELFRRQDQNKGNLDREQQLFSELNR